MQYEMSERHACRLMGLGRSTHRYRAQKAERDSELRIRLKELAAKRMRFGYRRLTAMLLREGMPANHKRVYRLYREEGLAMRIRQRRRIRWNGVVTREVATRPNERWSMDFVSDCVSTGKVIRMLTIVDDCTRECPAIEVDTSLGGLRVRTLLVVILPPGFDLSSCVAQTGEPVRVQAFIAQSTVEALYVRILHRLARLNELQCHTTFCAPGGQRPTAKLRSVVHNNYFW